MSDAVFNEQELAVERAVDALARRGFTAQVAEREEARRAADLADLSLVPVLDEPLHYDCGGDWIEQAERQTSAALASYDADRSAP